VAQRGFAANTNGATRRFLGFLPVARQTTKTDRLPHAGQRNEDFVVQAALPPEYLAELLKPRTRTRFQKYATRQFRKLKQPNDIEEGYEAEDDLASEIG